MGKDLISVVPATITERRLKDSGLSIRKRQGAAGNLTVACILDNLSFGSFEPEADFQQLTMRDWLVELTASQPDLLFVESAWRGHNNTWWNEVHRCGPELLGILEWCRDRYIPTVFWNKEDPVHFSTFLKTASKFDHVFTTDIDCIPRYRATLKHDNVYFLPFAAQLATHNPVEVFERLQGCAFAGAYYRKYSDRNKDFDTLLPELLKLGDFHIYDRNFGDDHPDHKFPDAISKHIVGTLDPRDIDIAYKGYTHNLNLNSVKSSQSMFARRVFELLACNTVIVSNFSRGLRLAFGDLTISTDGASEVNRRISEIRALPNGSERLRALALRKVVRQHTYTQRLEEIARRVNLPLVPNTVPSIAIIANVSSVNAASYLVNLAERQTVMNWRLYLLCEQGDTQAYRQFSSERVSISYDQILVRESIARDGHTHLACWEQDSWYGDEYLLDLLDALRWADVSAVGHAEHFKYENGFVSRVNPGKSWTYQRDIPLARGMLKVDNLEISPELLEPEFCVSGLAVSTLEFMKGGRHCAHNELQTCQSPSIDQGLSFDDFQNYADQLSPEKELSRADDDNSISIEWLLSDLNKVRNVEYSLDNDGNFEISSTLAEGQHTYAYSQSLLEPKMLPSTNGGEVYFEATPGLNLMLTLIFFDSMGTRLGHSMVANSANSTVSWPDGTSQIRVGVRVMGPGVSSILNYSRAARQTAAHPLVPRQKNLVVTNIFPSYESLYRNGFVASRLRAYKELGFDSEVYCAIPNQRDLRFRDFAGFDVATGNIATLRETVDADNHTSIMIHFLTPDIWESLKASTSSARVIVWIHGFEIQPWWRRKSQYSTVESQEQAEELWRKRHKMWSEVFTSPPEGWHFVFVSSYLAEQAFSDHGQRLPDGRFSIIHNHIDTQLFTYEQKRPEQRFRVLSIRPYSSPIYGNDLSVKAIIELSKRSRLFDKFEFSFYGEGSLFESTLEPIRDFHNVKIHNEFLTHVEIAALHKTHGVFLVPSRMDTQGVSRGEAMSSGLVPISNSIAAIPEFVDESCGLLAPGEDYVEISNHLERLANDPDLFVDLSQGAAARVRAELSRVNTILEELKLVENSFVDPERCSHLSYLG
ncbi:MAG: glycosyltransferase family protein [Gulosibacter sp.]|uniref:glycosyltransferase family protein n=1 Tax=Gulosibacter sp. TaxID=2817531 RepID=UPI003F906F6B